MKLKHLCSISTGSEQADFWVVRRGSVEKVGKPTFDFNPEHYAVTVTRTDKIIPKWLYYVFEHLHSSGYFKPLATGTLRLVNIRKSDLENIEFKEQGQ